VATLPWERSARPDTAQRTKQTRLRHCHNALRRIARSELTCARSTGLRCILCTSQRRHVKNALRDRRQSTSRTAIHPSRTDLRRIQRTRWALHRSDLARSRGIGLRHAQCSVCLPGRCCTPDCHRSQTYPPCTRCTRSRRGSLAIAPPGMWCTSLSPGHCSAPSGTAHRTDRPPSRLRYACPLYSLCSPVCPVC